MNRMRYAMVDDEPAARRKLKRMMNDFPEWIYKGEAGCISDALTLIESKKPDVLFLDIKLSGETGFDLLDQLPHPVHVIFVTAYDDFALKAFEANAIDYLMKPTHPERLKQCIQKLERMMQPPQNKPVIFKDISGEICKLSITDIRLITADGDYCKILSAQGDFLVRRTMKSWLTELPEYGFEKLSRSTIIHLDSVVSAKPQSHAGALVTLLDRSDPAPVSPTEWTRLKARLSID